MELKYAKVSIKTTPTSSLNKNQKQNIKKKILTKNKTKSLYFVGKNKNKISIVTLVLVC